LEIAKYGPTSEISPTSRFITYNAIRLAVKRKGLNMEMNYCRKIFASYLRQSGIEAEIVDLLQRRVPKSVFARHYFTPSLNYREKVLHALHHLKKNIEQ
jgi:intergrase/recombinase